MTDLHKNDRFSYRALLISLAAGAVFFILVHFAAAYLLSKVSHFETYYGLASWLCFLLSAVVFAALHRRGSAYALPETLLSASILSLLLLLCALFFGGEGKNLILLACKCVAMLGTAFFFAWLFERQGKNRSGKKRKALKKFRH